MSTDQPLSPLDSLFLWGETPDTMMHVAALLPFTPPPDAPPTYLRDIADEARELGDVQPPWNRRLRHPRLLTSPVQSWVKDDDFDLDYHLRRSALASPGDERELGTLVSRLHSHPLDFTRPPWEMHFIEGLHGGRFAVYVKIHHALVDGFTGMKILRRSLAEDPDDRTSPLFFNVSQPKRERRKEEDDSNFLADMGKLGRAVAARASGAVSLGGRIADPLVRRGRYADLVGNLDAPRTILNSRIGRNRRFATQTYSFDRMKAIGDKHGSTLNDVFLTIVGGGLRTYLSSLDELPEKPLIAFLPVNVRSKDDAGGGNAIGAILASVGTDIEDPLERLAKVTASTTAAKAQLEGMTQEAILAYSAYLMSPSGMQTVGAMTGTGKLMPTTFNLCVSNVPGPRHPLYLRGSRLESAYPVSIPAHGMALNVTVQSYDETFNVGFIGCRDAVPHLQRLAVATGAALDALDG